MLKRIWLIALAVVSLTMTGLPAVQGEEVALAAMPVAQTDDKHDTDKAQTPSPMATETERYVVEFAGRPDLGPAYEIQDFAARGEFVVDELRSVAEASQRAARDLVARRGVVAEAFWFHNTMIVDADEDFAAELAALPGVTAVRPERIYPLVRPVEAGEPIVVNAGDPEWGVAQIGADLVWDEGILGGGVVVANVDTGVDYTHEALTNQYRGNLGGGDFSHDYNWWDPTGICGDTPCDNDGHGSHTMGTMVGGDGPGPFAPDIGVAPGAQWIAAKGCEDFGCSESALLSAGQFLLAPTDLNGENPDPAKRPDIINNSWGGGPGDEFYLETVQNWRAAGIIPVFSTGNPGPFCGEGGSPGDFNETFSVGATDIEDVIAEFSGRGPSVFGKINPNVSAPGVDVTSSFPGDTYGTLSGTSMAAPHAAGTLALVLSSAPELIGDFDGATAPVAQTALDIIDLTCGGDDDGDPNNVYGEGRIDAFAAVQLVATGGTLAGTVTNADTGAVIPGVRIEATANDRTYAATGGSDGSYSMFLPAGEYFVTAGVFGFETGIASGVVVETDVTTEQDFALTALPSFTVSGRVLRAENGAAVVGAEVAALGVPVPPAITGTDGGYSLTLPAGDYTVQASLGRCLTTDEADIGLFADIAGQDFALVQRIDDFGHGCQSIGFDWVDARTPTTVYGDDQTGRMPLPFAFPFFGSDYNEVFIASNGYVTFEDEFFGFSDYFNRPIPDGSAPNAAIYAMWQDLWVVEDAHIDWAVVGRGGKQAMVIEFANVPRLGDGAGADFEIKLWRDGTIDLLYGANVGNLANGGEATVGIEDAAGSDGLMYSHRESVIEPESAIRFREVPTGLVTGTVTNANDGLPVAGVSVIADPTGRTATTDGDGLYALKLVPGTYTVTFEAAGYESQTREVTLRRDEVVTIDVALEAPVAVVTPAEIQAEAEIGQPVTAAVTIANTGTGVLTWEALERDQGATPPDLPPATERVTRHTEGAPFYAPEGFQPDLRAWPTFDGPLQTVIEDPAGDSQGRVDVLTVSGGAGEFELSMEIGFTEDTPMSETVGFVFLDTDQDPSTGLPPEEFYGLPSQDIGMDYFVDLFPAPEGFAWVVDATDFFIVAEIAVETIGQTYRFDIPLEAIGDDGAVDVAMAMSDFDFFQFDWAPDEGHGTIEPFRDAPWMSVEPVSGSVEPGSATEVTVTLGGEGFDPGEYSGIVVFLTNDPRQGTHEVQVDLSIALPADFGGLQGVVTNSRTGSPVPADIVVEAERDGAPYPVAAFANPEEDGYLLFAPAGTWPLTATWDGYAPFSGEVTVTAGATATQDIALNPLWPDATLEGGPIEVSVVAGDTDSAELQLGNIAGLAALEFEVFELEGAAPEPVAIRDTNPNVGDIGTTSAVAPEERDTTGPPARVNDGGPTAVFMDLLPWDSEALFIVLDANEVAYDQYGSADMGAVDLGDYQSIIIANDQPQSFYDAYVDNAAAFDDFVAGGGYLWFEAAAWGWNGGDLTGVSLPGGVVVGGELYEELNTVVDADHPVMAGVPDPWFGSLASHSWFDNTPEGTVLAAAADAGLPTIVDYGYGAGRVLATAQPLEFNWLVGEDGALILENAVPYVAAFQPFTDVPWLSEDPASGVVAEGAVAPIVVTVDATGLEPGVYVAEVVVVTNDPLNSTLRTQVTMTVTG